MIFNRVIPGILLTLCGSCATQKPTQDSLKENVQYPTDKIVYSGEIVFKENSELDKEVIIMPTALIRTWQGSKVIFKKKVTILGECQVFDKGINLQFEPGTIDQINVSWFGAKGYDTLDDTESFQQAIRIACNSFNTMTIFVPVGRYFISKTLLVRNDEGQIKPINWLGGGMSSSGIQGASLSWTGTPASAMFKFENLNSFSIKQLDFTAEPNSRLLSNLEFRPFINQVMIRDCSFTGTAGPGSCNINLNDGGGDQVSEVHIENCLFNGIAPEEPIKSYSAIKGGMANTKNFYIENCTFSAYAESAVNINISDVVKIEGCTFANNAIDISCMLCGIYAVSNYSEHSLAFFNGGSSSNIAFSTFINNVFIGGPGDGYVIRDGSGSLVLVNNDFGGGDQADDENRVRWEGRAYNYIYSVGNFFKNAGIGNFPFYNRTGQVIPDNVFSVNDLGGKNGSGKVPIKK